MFKKSILNNGMRLVTEQLPQFQSLSIGVWVAAGTRHEARGEEGLSHFLEHMMFKGTETRSALQIALAVDQVGGEFNAFTTREYTCFHLVLLSRDLDLAVDIMTDVLLRSTFLSEEIERERKVILQEISMVEDNPEELVHDLFFKQAFGSHPLGLPILGSRKAIEEFDRSKVREFFAKHYDPKRMVVSVAGNVEHSAVKKLLNRALGKPVQAGFKSKGMTKLSRTKRGPTSVIRVTRPRLQRGIELIPRSVEQGHIVVGFPNISNHDPDRFAAFILNTYLGGGMSSSLFQEIREKRGLAYTIYSSLAPFSDCGLFSVYIGTSPREIGTCLEVVGRELQKLKRAPLEKRVLEMLKNNLRGTLLLNSDSVENRMNAIAKNEMFFGQYVSLKEMTRRIEKVRPEDIQRLARQYFQLNKMIVTVLGPRLSAKARRGLNRCLASSYK